MSSTTTNVSNTPSTEETGDLIASNKVEGTAVYNKQGERSRSEVTPSRLAILSH